MRPNPFSPEANLQAIEAAIRHGLKATPLPLSEDDAVVTGLLDHLSMLGPEKQNKNYAYVVAANFARDAMRAAVAAARRRARNYTEALRAEEHDERENDFEQASVEFEEIVDSLRSELTDSQRRQLYLLRETVFGGRNMQQLASEFGVSLDVAYQWKRRATLLVQPKASERLREFLGTRVRHAGGVDIHRKNGDPFEDDAP